VSSSVTTSELVNILAKFLRVENSKEILLVVNSEEKIRTEYIKET